jgi:hypothetical protein
MTVARKPGHREEREISRKPLRRESRRVSGFTCGPTPVLFVHGTHGCNRHPAFPAPSAFMGGWKVTQSSDVIRRENADVCLESRNTLDVVRPSEARAGPHNHKCKLVRNAVAAIPLATIAGSQGRQKRVQNAVVTWKGVIACSRVDDHPFFRYAAKNTRVALSTTVAICSADGEGLAWKMNAWNSVA